MLVILSSLLALALYSRIAGEKLSYDRTQKLPNVKKQSLTLSKPNIKGKNNRKESNVDSGRCLKLESKD